MMALWLCVNARVASLKEGINKSTCISERDTVCVVADSFAPHRLFL